MVPDPDNKMDELLKAYAKKRREQASDPLPLHPATRNLLQTEAAKLAPKDSRAAGSWFDWFRVFWPRVAFALSVFLVLGLAAWALFKPPSERMEFSQLDAKRRSENRATDRQTVTKFSNAFDQRTAQKNRTEALAERVNALGDESQAALQKAEQPAELTRQLKLAAKSGPESEAEKKQIDGLAKAVNESRVNLRRQYAPTPESKQAATQASTEPSARVAPTSRPAQPLTAPVPAAVANAPVIEEDAVKRSTEAASKPQLAEALSAIPSARQSSAVPGSAGTVTQPSSLPLRGAGPEGGSFGGGRGGGYAGADASRFGIEATDSKPPGVTLSYLAAKDLALGERAKAGAPADAPQRWYFDRSGLSRDLALSEGAAIATNQATAGLGVANGRTTANQATTRGLSPGEEVSASTAPYARLTLGSPVLATQWSESRVRYRMTNQSATANADYYYRSLREAVSRRDGAGADKRTTELSQKLARAQVDVKAKEDTLSSAPATILNSFEVEQLGKRLRIVEADGSVYEVRFMAAIAGSANAAGREVRQRYALQRAEVEGLRGNAANAPAQNFSFEAIGTNRSLNQVVTINGVWTINGGDVAKSMETPAASAPTDSALSLSVRGPEPAPRIGPSLATAPRAAGQVTDSSTAVEDAAVAPAHIRAKARIGAHEIDINAVRVTP